MLAATRRYFVVIGLTLEVDVENKHEPVDDVITTRLMSRNPKQKVNNSTKAYVTFSVVSFYLPFLPRKLKRASQPLSLSLLKNAFQTKFSRGKFYLLFIKLQLLYLN